MTKKAKKTVEKAAENCIVAQREELAAALPVLKAASSPQPMLKVLSHVLLVPDGTHLTLAATDLSAVWTTRIPCKCAQGCAVAVPAAVFSDIVGAWQTTTTIQMSVDEEWVLHLTGEDGHAFALNGVSPEEFPMGWQFVAPEELPGTKFPVGRQILSEVASMVAPVAAQDDARPVLKTVYMMLDGERLQAVATDGFRMARVRWALKTEETLSFMVPAHYLRQFVGKFEDDVLTMAIDGTTMIIRDSNNQLRCYLAEGTYPDFAAVIPKGKPRDVIVMERERLMKAMKPLGKVDRKAYGLWEVGTEAVSLTIKSAEVGTGTGHIPAAITLSQPPVGTFALNMAFAEDAIAPMTSELVKISLYAADMPILITPEDSPLDSMQLLMPMMLGK